MKIVASNFSMNFIMFILIFTLQVRPEEVLEKALSMVQMSQKNYLYKCDQLKSIRQDLTVQRIRNQLTAKVYLSSLLSGQKGYCFYRYYMVMCNSMFICKPIFCVEPF